jgi:aminomethyltransferase
MRHLPLHAWHAAHGAKMGEFAGFAMPLYYGKPLEEHHRVRRQAGVFDISHMGQFTLTGRGAEALLRRLLPNDVAGMSGGAALYSPLCRDDGGVLDDLIVYRLQPERWRIIVNAATREKDFAWMQRHVGGYPAELKDVSGDCALFAVQGPEAFARLAPCCGMPPGRLRYYTFAETTCLGVPVFLARTGYTGEPGCEIAVSRDQAQALWEGLTGELALPPIGLAARDTLRLEAALPLYGHELREEWNPLECGLAWTVKLAPGRDFIGRAALERVKAEGARHAQAGLEIIGRGIPREGYRVLSEGRDVGVVTSGSLSPTLGKPIALARLEAHLARVGTRLQVEIRDKPVEAVVVARPFYRNPALRAEG